MLKIRDPPALSSLERYPNQALALVRGVEWRDVGAAVGRRREIQSSGAGAWSSMDEQEVSLKDSVVSWMG